MVSPRTIHKVPRWGISLPRGAGKGRVFILIGIHEGHLVHPTDNPRFSHIDNVGLMARRTHEEMHFLIIRPESDMNPPGTALLRLTVDSGVRGKSFITHDPQSSILSLHTYQVPGPSGSFSRSDLLAVFKPGEVIHMERTGVGITHPYGTVRNVDSRIESSWTMNPA